MRSKNIAFLFILPFLCVFLGLSTASAQINWTKYAGNPVLTNAGVPSVIKDGAIYKMWMAWPNFTEGELWMVGVCYSTSGDGIHWTTHNCSNFTNGKKKMITIPYVSVIKDGSIYRMWFSATDGIYYASSTDGMNWTLQSDTPVLTADPSIWWESQRISDPCVIKDGDFYKMWYVGETQRDPGETDLQIGYATSSDGLTWQKYDGNPVIKWGARDQWDGEDIMGPVVMKDGNLFMIWYTGVTSATPQEIGYATSFNGINWAKEPTNPVLHLGPNGEWDSYQIYSSPAVIKDGSVYKMWYTGWDQEWEPGVLTHIGYATSQATTRKTRPCLMLLLEDEE